MPLPDERQTAAEVYSGFIFKWVSRISSLFQWLATKHEVQLSWESDAPFVV